MSKKTNKHSNRYAFDPKSRFKNFQSTGFLGLKVIHNKGRYDELEELDEHNTMTRFSINKIKETAIKEMLYSGREIPAQWSKKLDFKEKFINLVNKDEDFEKYIRNNDCLTRIKIFNNSTINADFLQDKPPSFKQIELCRPISGIRKLIETQKIRKESPESTFCDVEKKDTFDDPKIIFNDSNPNTNNKKLYKNDSSKKIEDSLLVPTPQKKNKESSMFNIHTIRRDNLAPINEKIEVIAEEGKNEFLLTGVKFNPQKKQLKSSYNHYETENGILSTNKVEKDTLPLVLKRSSHLFHDNVRENLLLGRNQTNYEFNSPNVNNKSIRNSINLTKNAFQNNLNALISPSNLHKHIHYNTKEKENTDEKSSFFKKTKQYENKFTSDGKNDTKENLNSNIIGTSKNVLPRLYKKGKELITHTIIDYCFNKSDFISPDKIGFEKNKNIKIDTIPMKTSENLSAFGNTKKKLDIKNEKIKNLLEKSKEKGYYAPYFSLCKNCNERNNDFYNQIDFKNAMGIINIINKVGKNSYNHEKF